MRRDRHTWARCHTSPPLAPHLTDILVEGGPGARPVSADRDPGHAASPGGRLSAQAEAPSDAPVGAGQFVGGIVQLSVLTGLRKLRLRGFSMAQDSGVRPNLCWDHASRTRHMRILAAASSSSPMRTPACTRLRHCCAA